MIRLYKLTNKCELAKEFPLYVKVLSETDQTMPPGSQIKRHWMYLFTKNELEMDDPGFYFGRFDRFPEGNVVHLQDYMLHMGIMAILQRAEVDLEFRQDYALANNSLMDFRDWECGNFPF